MKITGERSQPHELIVKIYPASQNLVLLLSQVKKNFSGKSQKLSVADTINIGFWIVFRITRNAGEPGSEIGWDQGDK